MSTHGPSALAKRAAIMRTRIRRRRHSRAAVHVCLCAYVCLLACLCVYLSVCLRGWVGGWVFPQTFFSVTELIVALCCFHMVDATRPVPTPVRLQLLWTIAVVATVHLVQSSIDQGF
jgi:hypothetical protein